MEIKFTEQIESLVPREIKFNSEEIKRNVMLAVEKYRGVIYAPENIITAKEDRAKLNKFVAAIDEKRKYIKKAYLLPYENFERSIREITELLLQPIAQIDKQIKEFERIADEEKKKMIEAYFIDKVGSLKGIVEVEQIFKPVWLNTTYRERNIFNEIDEFIKQTQKDLNIIDKQDAKYRSHIKEFYLNCFDLSLTFEELERYKNRILKIEALEKAEVKEEPLQQLDLRITATATQLAELKKYLIGNKIKFGQVTTGQEMYELRELYKKGEEDDNK